MTETEEPGTPPPEGVAFAPPEPAQPPAPVTGRPSVRPRRSGPLMRMGPWALVLLGVVGTTCALSASGLLARSSWGYRLALAVLTVTSWVTPRTPSSETTQGRLSAYPLAVC